MRKSLLDDIRSENFDSKESACKIRVTPSRVCQILNELVDEGKLLRDGTPHHRRYRINENADTAAEPAFLPSPGKSAWLSDKSLDFLSAIQGSEKGSLTGLQLSEVLAPTFKDSVVKIGTRLAKRGYVSLTEDSYKLTEAGKTALKSAEDTNALRVTIREAIGNGDGIAKIAKDLGADSGEVWKTIRGLQKEGKVLHEGKGAYRIDENPDGEVELAPAMDLKLPDNAVKFLKAVYNSDQGSLSRTQLTGILGLRSKSSACRIGTKLIKNGYVVRKNGVYELTEAGKEEALRQSQAPSGNSSRRRLYAVLAAFRQSDSPARVANAMHMTEAYVRQMRTELWREGLIECTGWGKYRVVDEDNVAETDAPPTINDGSRKVIVPVAAKTNPKRARTSPFAKRKEALHKKTQHIIVPTAGTERADAKPAMAVTVANPMPLATTSDTHFLVPTHPAMVPARMEDVRISLASMTEFSGGRNAASTPQDLGYPPIRRIDFTMPKYVIELGPVQTTSAVVAVPSTAAALAILAEPVPAFAADVALGANPQLQETLATGKFVDFANLYLNSVYAGRHLNKVAERNAEILAIIALDERRLPLSVLRKRLGARASMMTRSLDELAREGLIECIPSPKANRFRIKDGAFGIADVASAIANNKQILQARAGQAAKEQSDVEATKMAAAQGVVVEILKEKRYMRPKEIANTEKAMAANLSLQDIRDALKELMKNGVAELWSKNSGKYYLKGLDSEKIIQDSSDSINVELVPAESITRTELKSNKGSSVNKNKPYDAQTCNAILNVLGKLGLADVGAISSAIGMDQSKVANALSALKSASTIQFWKKGYYVPDPATEVRADILEKIGKTGSCTPEEITEMTGRKKPDVVHAIATLVSDGKLARGGQGYHIISDSPPLPRLRDLGRTVREAVPANPISSKQASAPPKVQLKLLFKTESGSAAVRPDLWFPVFKDSKDGLPLKDFVMATSKGKIRFPRMYCEVVEKGREKSLDKVIITYVFVSNKGAIFGDQRHDSLKKNDVHMKFELYAGDNRVASLTRACSRRNVPVRAMELRGMGDLFRAFESGISNEVPFGFSEWGQEIPIDNPLDAAGSTYNKKELDGNERVEGAGTIAVASAEPLMAVQRSSEQPSNA